MKFNIYNIILAIAILSITSCAKEVTNNLDPINSTIVTDSSFQPKTAGSFWVYKNTDSVGVLKDTSLVTATSKDTTINTLPYSVLNYDTTHQYQYLVNNRYMLRSSAYTFNTSFGPVSVTGINLDYIDNINDVVGTQWNFMFVDGGNISVNIPPVGPTLIPTNGIGIINGAGLSLTVNGTTYNNVILSHIAFTALISLPNYTTIGSMDIYTAKGVGIIKTITRNQKNQITAVQTLKNYQIM